MTKTSTAATLQPFSLAVGQGVFYEDLQTTAEMLNYAAGNSAQQHVAITCGGASWWSGGTGETPTHSCPFSAAINVWDTIYDSDIWIDSDDQVVTVEATCIMAASNTGEIRFTVGAAAASTLTPFPASATTTLSANINVSSTGSGWRRVLVEARRTAVSGTNNSVRHWRVFAQEIAATSLPDPADT